MVWIATLKNGSLVVLMVASRRSPLIQDEVDAVGVELLVDDVRDLEGTTCSSSTSGKA